MIKTSGAKAYQKQLERGAEGAKPEELIGFLFTHLIETLAKSRQFIAIKNFEGKANKINLSVDILTALEQSLDHKQGGELASNLQALYQYSIKRLLEAHINNDIKIIEEVMDLMREIQEGWQGILR
ncbi:MAG: flagellar export chaperone FliS [Endozoicomonas sp. (ex Botrylloides leachii)]|nr:flagellar export chaperone FliS [Endozoicomonas sp. (ex Botrylloides leachii)]